MWCESTVVPWKKINITDDGDNDKKKGIVATTGNGAPSHSAGYYTSWIANGMPRPGTAERDHCGGEHNIHKNKKWDMKQWSTGLTRLFSYFPWTTTNSRRTLIALLAPISLWMEYQPQTHFNLCRMTRDQNAKPIGCRCCSSSVLLCRNFSQSMRAGVVWRCQTNHPRTPQINTYLPVIDTRPRPTDTRSEV